MFLDQKEFSLIFSKDSSVAESFIEDLLNNKDPKFVIYFLNFINNFGKDAPEKVVSFFNKYYQDTENVNCKVINIFLNFIFDIHYNYGENLLPLIKKYFECEQEYDKIFDITRKAIKNNLNQRTIHELLNLFYLKIKELEFRDFYLKNITNILKETNRIIELENFLTTIYNEIKIYWIVEKLVDIYSSKEEYEKLTNIFVGMITSGEFAKAWAESLGIIDTTIEKIIDKQNVIPKIIPHLQSINSLLEKSPKNVYKIYKGIVEYLENLSENDKNEFLKSFYNFIDISNTNNILTNEQIINIVINVIEKSYSSQTLEKITEILNNKTEIIV
ncbi:MAG: hypothetical protein RMJ36_06110, partial [Candidatus Calescibacterium sp.]|nr:hypothetical protein [Candidatus Calescibacterium sp.]MDW8133210.1 hypothetical protein [Candidatus Calescibacterium sp.]